MAGWRRHHPGLTAVKAKRLERVQHHHFRHLLWDTKRKAEKTFEANPDTAMRHIKDRHKRVTIKGSHHIGSPLNDPSKGKNRSVVYKAGQQRQSVRGGGRTLQRRETIYFLLFEGKNENAVIGSSTAWLCSCNSKA